MQTFAFTLVISRGCSRRRDNLVMAGKRMLALQSIVTVICLGLPSAAANDAATPSTPDSISAEAQQSPPLPSSIFSTRRPPLIRESAELDPQRWDRMQSAAPFTHPSLDPLPGPRTGQRVHSAETNLMELRWHMGVPHAGIPTLEVAGCDLIAPRYFESRTDTPTVAAIPLGRLGRARHWVSNTVSGFVR